jgi:hypothetical protein
MPYIQKTIENFSRDSITDNLTNHLSIVLLAKKTINTIYKANDKIRILTGILEASNKEYENHVANCRTPNCPYDEAITYISYQLNQELERLGVVINEDAFTCEEKIVAEDKIQQIINELQTLKDGQQIIYDKVVKEFNELKDLIYLGKDKWYKTLLGTSVNLVASGVVSEATAKPILNIITKDVLNPFIDMIKDNVSQLTQ